MRAILGTLIAFLVLAAIPFASAQTTVDSYWTGSGFMSTSFVAGDDAHSYFETKGTVIMGEFHGKDYDDNPCNYKVDTVSSFVKASVNNGYMKFENTRDDSYTPMYGNAGQYTYSFIGTDGTGEMMFGTRTNYAEMSNCQYGWGKTYGWTTNGVNFEATGNNYLIDHVLTDSSGDGAQVTAYGSGSAQVKVMGEKSGGKNSYFNMGRLPVCGDGCAWDNKYAKFSGSGTGTFEVHAWADTQLKVGGCGNLPCSMTIPGDGTDNSAQYHLKVLYAGTWSYSDFGVSGN
ncbi:MAG: hypothetical protein J7K72_04565 [Candidatus Aenigmarchaeota archaeon]|nr:hypothetical protein [Candidatus Aenigmarchaeota archaeon]